MITNGKLENAGNRGVMQIGCRQNTVFVFRATSAANAITKLKFVLLPPAGTPIPSRPTP